MKLLHVINDLSIGGAQKLVHDLCLIQKNDSQIEVTCFIFKKTDSEIEHNLIENGIDVVTGDSSFISIPSLKKLMQQMKRADIVHVHLFPSNYIVPLLNTITQKKIIFTEHSTHNRRREHSALRPIEQFIYNRFSSIACISEATAINLIKWIDSKTAYSRMVVIGNGIDLERFSKTPQRSSSDIFGRPGIPIIMVSRLTASKDHPTVIRALSLIEDNNVFVVFVGDGERRKELEELARDYRVENRVVFLGTRVDMPELIRSAFIGIQSSNWEGFGLTAVEIMASGRPIIASDVNGLNNVVKDAGLLFPHGDEYALAECIRKVLSDQKLYVDLQRKGVERSKKYSINSTAEKYKALYKNLLTT